MALVFFGDDFLVAEAAFFARPVFGIGAISTASVSDSFERFAVFFAFTGVSPSWIVDVFGTSTPAAASRDDRATVIGVSP